MEPTKTPVAGDTVPNENGEVLPGNQLPQHVSQPSNQPAQSPSNGNDGYNEEANRLLEEANQKVKEERLAREKAEQKIVQMKRDGASTEDVAKAFAEFQSHTQETLDRIQREREDDKEATKLVVASLLKQSRENGELKAALANGAGIPNVSSQNPPAPANEPTLSAADLAIKKWHDRFAKKK